MKNLFETSIGIRFAAAVGALLTVAGCATNDCSTIVRNNTVRSGVDDSASATKWAEVTSTNCRYRGNTDPKGFKTPGHLEHMNSKPGTAPKFSAWQ